MLLYPIFVDRSVGGDHNSILGNAHLTRLFTALGISFFRRIHVEPDKPMYFSEWVRGHYGCKRGFARSMYHGLLDATGRYTRYENVDWGVVHRLVFLCQGNICRSAYAEARASSLGLNAISFGLNTQGGDLTPSLIQKVAMEKGIDLQKHRSRSLSDMRLNEADLVLGMEPMHVRSLCASMERHGQMALLGLWCRPRRPHIEDPYGLMQDYVRICFDRIDQAVSVVAAHLRN